MISEIEIELNLHSTISKISLHEHKIFHFFLKIREILTVLYYVGVGVSAAVEAGLGPVGGDRAGLRGAHPPAPHRPQPARKY